MNIPQVKNVTPPPAPNPAAVSVLGVNVKPTTLSVSAPLPLGTTTNAAPATIKTPLPTLGGNVSNPAPRRTVVTLQDTPGGGGGGSSENGAIVVPDNYFFQTDVARDAYFATNPAELIDGHTYVVVDGTLQRFQNNAWVDLTAVIRGPAGQDGAPGAQGIPGPQGLPGQDGAPGAQGIPGRDGNDGQDGAPGQDGIDGVDGQNGRSIWAQQNSATLNTLTQVIAQYPGFQLNDYLLITRAGVSVFGSTTREIGQIIQVVSETEVSSANQGNIRGPAGAGGIPEAPNDSKIYGRQNSAWAEVPSGGGGGVQSVTALQGETLVAVNNSDAVNPVVSATQALKNAVTLAGTALQSFSESDPVFTAAQPTLALKSEIPNVSSFVTQSNISASIATHDGDASAHSDIRAAIAAETSARTSALSGVYGALETETMARESEVSRIEGLIPDASDFVTQSNINTSIAAHDGNASAHSDIRAAITSAVSTHNSNASAHSDIRTSVTAVSGRVDTVEGKIPAQASAQNQLADKNFVNSSIEQSAGNRVTYTIVGEPFPTRQSLTSATTFYSRSAEYVPTAHDYCLITADEDAPAPFTGGQTRMEYDGTTWVYAYGINNRPFTAAEVAALESGITAALRTSYSNHIADSDMHITSGERTTWNAKQNALTAQTAISNAAVKITTNTLGQVTGSSALTKADVGLGNVDNTSDLLKPISAATQTAITAISPLEATTSTAASVSVANPTRLVWVPEA